MIDLDNHQTLEDLLDALNMIIDDYKEYKFLKYYIEQIKDTRDEVRDEFEQEEEVLAQDKKEEIQSQFEDYWRTQFYL